MIEVEKKFSLATDDSSKLIAGAKSLGEKVFTDIYFDDESYSLTSKDKWLRLRDDNFELKLPMNNDLAASRRDIDQYNELTDENKIRKALGIREGKDLKKDLAAKGFRPFCSLVTTRKKYKKGRFTIDLDEIDYGYGLGEIEVMVESKLKIPGALEEIDNFAEENGLNLTRVRGKVIEYLRRFKKEHYQALVDAGVI